MASQELLDFIRNRLAEHVSRPALENLLKIQGYSDQEIAEAFSEIGAIPIPTPVPASIVPPPPVAAETQNVTAQTVDQVVPHAPEPDEAEPDEVDAPPEGYDEKPEHNESSLPEGLFDPIDTNPDVPF